MKNNFGIQLATLLVACLLVSGCHSQEAMINSKNECYQKIFNSISTTELYKEVLNEFNDTIIFIRGNKSFFNESYEELKVDEAIFFKEDSLQCLMVVLSRNKDNKLVFGHARIFFGKKEEKKWKFKIGLQLSFDDDYFELYQNNDFERISKLARYSVLMDGRQPKDCGIDDEYWFNEMLKD